MSESDVISDFIVWSKDDEAPLSVTLLVKVSTRDFVKRIWTLENDTKKIEENHKDSIYYQYKNHGIYNDNLEIKLMREGGAFGGSRDFTVTVDPPKDHPLIKTIEHSSGDGFAYQGTRVKFTLMTKGVTANTVTDMTWYFENSTVKEPWDRGSFDKTHIYDVPGQYTEKVSIRKNGVSDSKLFYILILPKI